MNFAGVSEQARTEKDARLHSAYSLAVRALLDAREKSGHWVGELSSSALSTATAVCAFAVSNRNTASPNPKHLELIQAGLNWLSQNQNADGGWGDTDLSMSNISTTALCWSAFGAVPGADLRYEKIVQSAKDWLAKTAGGNSTEALVAAIEKRYGKDRTFSVPILMTCVLGNRFESGALGWKRVRSLPFELAALPHQIYGALQLPVVSYALPALIAIGQARFHHCPARNPFTFFARKWTQNRTLNILEKIQPENGGFLEAVPLTSFVAMSLASMKLVEHEVAVKAFQFLENSVRPDGSWPIDTNLSTWTTTLSINALSTAPTDANLNRNDAHALSEFLLKQQFKNEHAYTHAKPGGWAWTNLPGGVPDADDTAGALLALFHLGKSENDSQEAASAGLKWLLQLQNRDGGIPTFCRGWGALPFDRSGADLTAHAIRAWLAWLPNVDVALQSQIQKGIKRAIRFLIKSQRRDFSWTPLWFGNQHVPDEENFTYGTSRVVLALADLQQQGHSVSTQLVRGAQGLLSAQNKDGGWGGALNTSSSTEETALAVEALAACSHQLPRDLQNAANVSLEKGTQWLIEKIESGEWLQPSPIGFYFAKLWYHERLYPMIFTVAALGKALGAKRPLL
jgi:squalene-hopene/tetraprenyl-beta-curcumene cyclase